MPNKCYAIAVNIRIYNEAYFKTQINADYKFYLR